MVYSKFKSSSSSKKRGQPFFNSCRAPRNSSKRIGALSTKTDSTTNQSTEVRLTYNLKQHPRMCETQCGDCPFCTFCTLVSRKVQVCDVEIAFPDYPALHSLKTIGIPDQYTDLRRELILLALFYNNDNKNCKKGDGMTANLVGKFRLNVECLKKYHFKVCFHAEE
jgi:hypothetical protein